MLAYYFEMLWFIALKESE